MSEQHDRSREHFVKVAVHLPPSDWHPHAVETMWAESLGGDRYRLQSVPFYAYGLSFDDVVEARKTGGWLVVRAVVARGGHSTYRFCSRAKRQVCGISKKLTAVIRSNGELSAHMLDSSTIDC